MFGRLNELLRTLIVEPTQEWSKIYHDFDKKYQHQDKQDRDAELKNQADLTNNTITQVFKTQVFKVDSFNKFNPEKATIEEINHIIEDLKDFQTLREERPKTLSFPLGNGRKETDYQSKIGKITAKEEIEKEKEKERIYNFYYYDFVIWADFHDNYEIINELENAIDLLTQLRNQKLEEKNKEDDERARDAKRKEIEDDNISHEQTDQEKAIAHKKNDPFFSIYLNIPGELKSELEKSKIKIDIHELNKKAVPYTGRENKEEAEEKRKGNEALAARLLVILHTVLLRQSKYLKREDSSKKIAEIFEKKKLITKEMKNKIIKSSEHIQFQFNPAKVIEIKTQSPYSFAYQQLRNLLFTCGTDREEYLKSVFEKIDGAIRETIYQNENITEQGKLIVFEQAVLDVYFEARKTQGHRDSRLANALEWFIKNKHALDLMRKYANLNVPHKVPKTDNIGAPQLNDEKLVKIPKRIALIEIDTVKLNSQLTEKLKNEYDEVVFRTDVVDTSTPEFKSIYNSAISLNDKDFPAARITNLHYEGLTTQLRKENSDRDVEFSIFDNVQDNLFTCERNNLANGFYLVDEQGYHRLRKDSSFDIHSNDVKELIYALKKYVTRQIYLASNKDSHNNFFADKTAKQFKLKIDTANKLIEELEGKVIENRKPFNNDQIALVRNEKSSLGKIISLYPDMLPQTFLKDEGKHNKPSHHAQQTR